MPYRVLGACEPSRPVYCLEFNMLQYIWGRTRALPLVIGCLGLAGMLSEVWRDVLPVWGIIGTAIIPIAIHLIGDSELFSWRVVRYSHALAAIWFLVAAVIVLAPYPWEAVAAKKQWILPALTLIGAMQSVRALLEILRPAPGTKTLTLMGIVDGVAFLGEPGAPALDFDNVRSVNDVADEQDDFRLPREE